MTKYYSRSKGKFIDIANMPDQYVRNAFVKMCSTDAIEDVIYATQQKERADKLEVKLDNITYQPYDNEGRVRDYQVEYSKVARERDDYKKKANDMEMAKMTINREWLDTKDKLKKLEMENQHLVQQLEHDETVVSKQAYQVMWDNCEKLKQDYKYVNDRMMMYAKMLDDKNPKGDLKMFSEIPNTDEGWEFVSLLKKYLNNVSYKLRVRGQYLNDETKKNEGWRRYTYGQPIEKSRCLRVYVDLNKDVD